MKASARIDYAPPVLKRDQVQGLKEFRLTIRAEDDQGLVSSEKVWLSPIIKSPPPCLSGFAPQFRTKVASG